MWNFRQSVVLVCLLSGLSISACSLANANKEQTPMILGHEQPKITAPVTLKVPVFTNLVPFFKQGDWVKVGDPKNGQVVWVNIQQVQKSRREYFNQTYQSFYFSAVTNTDDKGNPKTKIVAYRNGKKLSDKETKALYEKMRHEQPIVLMPGPVMP